MILSSSLNMARMWSVAIVCKNPNNTSVISSPLEFDRINWSLHLETRVGQLFAIPQRITENSFKWKLISEVCNSSSLQYFVTCYKDSLTSMTSVTSGNYRQVENNFSAFIAYKYILKYLIELSEMSFCSKHF